MSISNLDWPNTLLTLNTRHSSLVDRVDIVDQALSEAEQRDTVGGRDLVTKLEPSSRVNMMESGSNVMSITKI